MKKWGKQSSEQDVGRGVSVRDRGKRRDIGEEKGEEEGEGEERTEEGEGEEEPGTG